MSSVLSGVAQFLGPLKNHPWWCFFGGEGLGELIFGSRGRFHGHDQITLFTMCRKNDFPGKRYTRLFRGRLFFYITYCKHGTILSAS